MPVLDQVITDQYALYNGDAIQVMKALKDQSIHMSLYSPPFMGLFVYSSSPHDLSNARSYEEFMRHYSFFVEELFRLTLPGRISAVHCMDVPGDGANAGADTIDFPGDIIRLHKGLGWKWKCRFHVWKEPLAVRNRTMAKGLMHQQLVEDSSLCDNAAADQLLIFVKPGENPVPIAHPTGLSEYIGETEVPPHLLKYRNWQGKQTQNLLSHWIWRRYASAFWSDVRLNRVLKYKEARDVEDEKHLHPLQLDVIERCVILFSNPGEIILSPFSGVGSEIFGSVRVGRRGIGVELKPSYFRQAIKNLESVDDPEKQGLLFDAVDDDDFFPEFEVDADPGDSDGAFGKHVVMGTGDPGFANKMEDQFALRDAVKQDAPGPKPKRRRKAKEV